MKDVRSRKEMDWYRINDKSIYLIDFVYNLPERAALIG